MTGAATSTERAFELHGVAVAVRSREAAVIDAMELRLRDFAPPPTADPTRTAGPTPTAGRTPTADPELRFEFVSGAVDDDAPLDGGARPVYDTPHGTLHYVPDADVLRGRLGGVELRCEAGRGVALFRSAAYEGRDLYLATHPLATISLMELLERRGLYALHAACLATGTDGGVLIAGASGAGKSTLALALAHVGMRFLSDDIVFLSLDSDSDSDSNGVTALGFADTVGLTDHAATHFPELRTLRDEPPAPGFPKRLHRIEDLFGAPAIPACRPCALVFPTVTPGQLSALDPLEPGDALLRLVPDVLLTDPHATHAHLRTIASLLKQVRCYTLRSGSDLERATELVRALA